MSLPRTSTPDASESDMENMSLRDAAPLAIAATAGSSALRTAQSAAVWLTKIRDLAPAYSSIDVCRSRWSDEKFNSTAIHGRKVSTDSS